MSFSTALTGLAAAQTELSTLSNNIANVGTLGFKRARVEFGDIVARTASQAAGRTPGMGVEVKGVRQQFGAGGLITSANVLDMAIGGEGFFTLRDPRGGFVYTRAGAFKLDAGRMVVDGEGRQVQAFATTPDGVALATGAAATRPLRLPEVSGEPRATSLIQLSVNLPAAAPAPTAAFDPTNPASYNAATSVQLFDSTGRPRDATVFYRKLDTPARTWEARTLVAGIDGGSLPPVTLTFDADGRLAAPSGPVDLGGGLSLSHDGDTTQFAEGFALRRSRQDGIAPGRLESVAIDDDGVVRASFSNGDMFAIGRLAIATAVNPQGLRAIDGANWISSPVAGLIDIGPANADGRGSVKSGALERSNVDLTEELVGLITAQRNFQANARAIDAAGQLLQTIVNLRS